MHIFCDSFFISIIILSATDPLLHSEYTLLLYFVNDTTAKDF